MNQVVDDLDISEGIEWEYDMPLLTNPFFMVDFAKVALLSPVICAFLCIVMCIYLDVMPFAEAVVIAGYILMIGCAALTTLIVFVCLVVLRNRFHTVFHIGEEGVVVGMSPFKLPGVSRESVRLAWEDVCYIDYIPSRRVISIKDSWRTVVRLYCTPENYHMVESICRWGYERSAEAYAASTKSRSQVKAVYINMARKSIPWIILATISALLLSLSPILDMPGYACGTLALLLLGCLPGGSGQRLFAVSGFTAVIVVFAATLTSGMHTTTVVIGYPSVTSAELAMQSHPAACILSLFGLLGLLVLSIRNITVKHSGADSCSPSTEQMENAQVHGGSKIEEPL